MHLHSILKPAYLITFLLLTFVLACSEKESTVEQDKSGWEATQDSTDREAQVSGFSGPEAVRYDAEQDVYFVSNFNGEGGERDANGFISKVSADGNIDSLRFMTGTEEYPLHAARGMYITGDTLWAADVDGIHGFNRATGEQLAFIDFSDLEPGFLNDIVSGPDGHLYVTDSGKASVYKIENGTPSIHTDSLPSPPNGITLNPDDSTLVLAPWGGGTTFLNISESASDPEEFARAQSGGNFDGIEFVNGKLIAASQNDSSLHVLSDGNDRLFIKLPGRPADIGIDTQRMHIAVPYVALNRVDIWQLPQNN